MLGRLALLLNLHDHLAARKSLGLLHGQLDLFITQVSAFGHRRRRAAQRHRRTFRHEVAAHGHRIARILHLGDGGAGFLRAVHRGVPARGAQVAVALIRLGRALHERRQLLGRLRLVVIGHVGFALPGDHRRRACHRGACHRGALLVGVRHQVATQADAVDRKDARHRVALHSNAARHGEREDLIAHLDLEMLPIRIVGKLRAQPVPRTAAYAERRTRLLGQRCPFGAALCADHTHAHLHCRSGRNAAFDIVGRIADAQVGRLLGHLRQIDLVAFNGCHRILRGRRGVGQFVSRLSVEALAVRRHCADGFFGRRGAFSIERQHRLARRCRFSRCRSHALGHVRFRVEALVQHRVRILFAEVDRPIGRTCGARFAGGVRGQHGGAGGHHVGRRLAVLGEHGRLARRVEGVDHDHVRIVG